MLPTTNTWTGPFLLNSGGTNYIHINSPVDSVYTLSIYRAPPSLTSITVVGSSSSGSSSVLLSSYLSSSFLPSITSYTLNLPFIYSTASAAALYQGTNTVYLDVNSVSPTSYSSGSFLPAFPLTATVAALLHVNSIDDGYYTLTITRQQADVKVLLSTSYLRPMIVITIS